MTLLFSKLREISIFIYTLIFLLVFNLYFNLNYTWYGVSLIVRIYLFVFSCYLVFIFASLDIVHLKKQYSEKFGVKGHLLLFLETRIFPFVFIYLFLIIFTLIDYVRAVNWPMDPILSLLNGRYSNTLIYSWLLLIILKLKKKPTITIPIYIALLFLYGISDKIIYSTIGAGSAISCIKILKIFIFFFFLFTEFTNGNLKRLLVSLIISLLIYLSIISTFSIIFKNTEGTFQSKESGLYLLKMGYSYPLEKLKSQILKSTDYDLLKNLLSLSRQYDIEIKYSKNEWDHLLFSGSVKTTDIISGYIINKNLNFSYDKIISYAEKQSEDEQSNLENADNFILLSSKHFIGHEKNLVGRMKKSNRKFKLWAMRIAAQNKSVESIPLLIVFTTDIDETIADSAYNALKIITEMDPAAALDKEKNDPDTIEIFKKYYLKYSQNRKVD
ncbi:MAG: hypothetical protein JXN64_01880 [Spirochaetes bacterium]|nr:hypothetical protein [Spirochaetota bacterium]